jgi:hypothetical protein
MKPIKTKCYKERLKGHKDIIISLFSPFGHNSGILMSASQDALIRGKAKTINTTIKK